MAGILFPRHTPHVSEAAADKPYDRALVWLRRDLRADDHAALYHALRQARRVWCAFVFDRAVLDGLPRQDRRVEFMRDSLVGVDAELRALAASHGVEGVGLIVRHGAAGDALPALAAALRVQAVFANHDDDPQARARDLGLHGRLADTGVALHLAKDHLVFERDELLTPGGRPFTAFAPYRNAWLRKLAPFYLEAYPVGRHAAALAPRPEGEPGVPALVEIGFAPTNLHGLRLPTGPAGAREMLAEFQGRIDHYHRTREFPAVRGPSYLGPHLCFGTLSVRRAARAAHERAAAGSRGAQAWLEQLIRRDFFHQVLHHHPQLATQSFKPAYDRIRWERGKAADMACAAWCEGRTGYPLVDAALQQLNQTGYMHERLRMVAAAFLAKNLGIDWRRGEAYFARQLNDFDFAANNGGWQWAVGSGCDAPPCTRRFDPVQHSRRLDPEGKFIRRYLPQLARLPDEAIHAPWLARPVDLEAAAVQLGRDYPVPIVDPATAQARTLERCAVVTAVRGA